jgi:NAD(P)H-binding
MVLIVKKLVEILPDTIKLITISNVGTGDSRKYQSYLVKHFLIDRYMMGILKDKLAAETALQYSTITKWTILRVPWLRDQPQKLDKVKFVDFANAKVTNKVNREDVAAVAIKLVEDGYGDDYWGQTLNLVSG